MASERQCQGFLLVDGIPPKNCPQIAFYRNPMEASSEIALCDMHRDVADEFLQQAEEDEQEQEQEHGQEQRDAYWQYIENDANGEDGIMEDSSIEAVGGEDAYQNWWGDTNNDGEAIEDEIPAAVDNEEDYLNDIFSLSIEGLEDGNNEEIDEEQSILIEAFNEEISNEEMDDEQAIIMEAFSEETDIIGSSVNNPAVVEHLDDFSTEIVDVNHCVICMDDCNSMRRLHNCGHRFCAVCLQRHIYSQSKKRYHCPICRRWMFNSESDDEA